MSVKSRRYGSSIKIKWTNIVTALLYSTKHLDRFDLNDDDEIMCKTEEDAHCIADFIEDLIHEDVHVNKNEDTGDEFHWVVYPD